MNEGSPLPQDLDACHRLIEQLSADREQLASRIQAQQAELQQQADELASRAALSEEQSRTVVELADSRQKLSQENEELKLTVRKLMERLYGRRSERFIADPNQLPLDFGQGDAAATVDALTEAVLEAERTLEEVESRRRRKRRKRQRGRSEKFPEHIPRYEKIVDLPEEEKAGKAFLGYPSNYADLIETSVTSNDSLEAAMTQYHASCAICLWQTIYQ